MALVPRGRKGRGAFLTGQDMRDAKAAPWSHGKDTGFKDLGSNLNSVWLRAPGKLTRHLGQHYNGTRKTHLEGQILGLRLMNFPPYKIPCKHKRFMKLPVSGILWNCLSTLDF